jgi:hypothetical protein
MSAEARQVLLARVDTMVATAKNPGAIADHYEREYARADALEKAGNFVEAAAIRTQATAEVMTLLSGTAGLIKGGAGLTLKLADTAGDIIREAPKPLAGTGHGIASAVTDAEAGGPNVGPWQEVRDNKIATKWPPNDGFKGTPVAVTLKSGTIIDRYGDNLNADFFAPSGTPLEARSLAPGSETRPYVKFEVVRPLET